MVIRTDNISTHTPLAGRDYRAAKLIHSENAFLLTRPLRDVTQETLGAHKQYFISTHTPLAGRDQSDIALLKEQQISTHTPLAGRDDDEKMSYQVLGDFYSHAPCGT